MSAATITLLIVLGAIVLFCLEVVPLPITALLVSGALVVTRVLPASDALSGFSNETTLLVLFMSPVGEALFRTGLGAWLGERLSRYARNDEARLVGVVTATAMALSAFSSNTATTLVLLPVVLGIAVSSRCSASKLLIPLSFGACMGGNLTLIGSPPNVLAHAAARSAGLAGFGFWDFAKVGLPMAVAGTAYLMYVGRKQLPDRVPAESAHTAADSPPKREKMWISVLILAGVIAAMMSIGWLESSFGITLAVVALIGAILTAVTGCLDMKEFYDSIDWTAVFLFAGMLPLGKAMQQTGAADVLARALIGLLPSQNPHVVLAFFLLASGSLAQFMSHTAATSIMAPVAVAMARALTLSPAPLLMGLVLSVGVAMATPIGTPPNVIVYGRGGYKFGDFVKVGLPMFVICVAVAVALLPVFFPL